MRRSIVIVAGFFSVLGAAGSLGAAELNNACTVSVENRSAPVQEAGGWVIPGVPATGVPLRVRATCVEDGVTRSGQSDWFRLAPNQILRVEDLRFDAPAAIPLALTLAAPANTLRTLGETAQLSTIARYGDGSTKDLTGSASGTAYTSSNPAIVAVDANGRVIARASGVALVTAANEGAVAILRLEVVTSGDSDGDGLPDDWELSHGLDPNDPIDAVDDPDRDSLSTADEYARGTDPTNPDTDGDGLLDGDEVLTVGTNPALRDTDGDQVSDGLEVRAGSNPLDPASVNLVPILTALSIEPSSFTIVVNTVVGEASRQVTLTADLVDQTRIDATARRYGASWSSTDLTIANFGAEEGRIFAGQPGQATVTATIGSSGAATVVSVESFSPVPLSFLPIPGHPNSVDVDESYAYVASGPAGLFVVDVTDPTRPVIVGSVDTPGNANDVLVRGAYAYVADGQGGLATVDVSSPSSPFLVSSLAQGIGNAYDLALHADRAYVGTESGLRIVDVSSAQVPRVVGGVDTVSRVATTGVDVDSSGRWVVAVSEFVSIIDARDPSSPVVVGRLRGRSNDVAIRGRLAYVGDWSFRIIDFSRPEAPFELAKGPGRSILTSLVLDDMFVLGSDIYFFNGVPIYQASPKSPVLAAELDFGRNRTFRDDNGTGIAVKDGLVFLTGVPSSEGDHGRDFVDGGLHIGRYRMPEDTRGEPPSVRITQPAPGFSVLERRGLTIEAVATDDYRVVGVEFLMDGQEIAWDYQKPYQATVTVPPGVAGIDLTAIALDAGGNEGTAEAVHVTVLPDSYPTVEILYPREGNALPVGSPLHVLAAASDDVGLARVELFIDGVSRGLGFGAPPTWDVVLPSTTGPLSLEAEVTDTIGNRTRSSRVTVTLQPDEPPLVAFVLPTTVRELVGGSTVRVSLAAIDDVEVVNVELLANGQSVFSGSVPPNLFEVAVPEAASELELLAVAVDSQGQRVEARMVFPVVSASLPTTVVGRVTDQSSIPVPGVQVACKGLSSLTGPDGGFTITAVPTATSFACSASFRDARGVSFSGSSATVLPVRGGTTDVGTIILHPDATYLYPGPQIPSGPGDVAIAAADLNGDGRVDLVTASGSSPVLTVILEAGNGSFLPPASVTNGAPALDLAVADFDGDGQLDLATLAEDGEQVLLLLGRGDGNFGEPVAVSIGSSVIAIAAADLDRNGRADLVVAAAAPGGTGIWLGAGDGTFEQSQILSVPGVTSIVVGDLDGNATLDLVLGSISYEEPAVGSDVPFYAGNGDGTFTFVGNVATGVNPSTIATADFDGDGRRDVAIGDFTSDRLEVYRSANGGTFAHVDGIPAAVDPGNLLAADFDADGAVDLAAVSFQGDQAPLVVARGRGDGTFDVPQFVRAGSSPSDLVAAELDGNGRLDLATVDQGAVTLVFSKVPLAFEARTTRAAGGPIAPQLSDVDGDGALDLVYASAVANAVVVELGRGDGTFASTQAYPCGPEPVALELVDFNGDGETDVMTWNEAGQVSLLAGNGDGTFAAERRTSIGSCTTGIGSGDFDRNGRLDLAATDHCTGDVAIYLGNGTGGFALRTRMPFGRAGVVEVADFDGDSRLDLAVGLSGGGDSLTANAKATRRSRPLGSRSSPAKNMQKEVSAISLFLGRGDGTFVDIGRIGGDAGPAALLSVDLDRDGVMDLVDVSDQTVGVRLGRGDASFIEASYGAQASALGDVRAGDLDGDDAIDLVVSGSDSANLEILLGRGDGTFQPGQLYAADGCPQGVAVGDLNGDGKLDLLAASACSDQLSILLHR